jgi:site-specific DNA recombinase
MADGTRYGCAGYLNRRGCKNTVRVRRDLVEEKCLSRLKQELSAPEREALFIKEAARLYTERVRASQSEAERFQRQLAGIEQEIKNLLTAIKQGIFTASTKAELEHLEAEQDRLRQQVQAPSAKVVSFLPRAKDRYEALLQNLSNISPRYREPLREQIHALVGKIQLQPMADGYLEAVMPPPFEGLIKLISGIKNAVGCGGRI